MGQGWGRGQSRWRRAHEVGGTHQVPGESCGVKRVRGEEGLKPPPPPLSHLPMLLRRPLFLLPFPTPQAQSELQDLAEFHGTRCFYRLRVDRPDGGTESSGVRRGVPAEEGNSLPSGFSSSPPFTRPGRARKTALGTNPHPQTPAVSPNSRRMELRKVPSSSSGSPVLGRESKEEHGMGKERQWLPEKPQ